MFKETVTLVGIATILAICVEGQQARWATQDDPTAKFIVDAERQWAEAACNQKITETILADDFQGTSLEGKRYAKAEEVEDTENPSKSARDCHLSDAKVRYFGDNVAMVCGSQSSIRPRMASLLDLD
jgi:hypothetical protein